MALLFLTLLFTFQAVYGGHPGARAGAHPEIVSLDLSRFVHKLMKASPALFPNASFTEGGITEYKKFLTIIKQEGIDASPSRVIDEVWHNHILDTRAYFHDSEVIFGKYLHHKPGFASTVEERKVFRSQYDLTLDAYAKLFGAPPAEYWPQPKEVGVDDNDCAACTPEIGRAVQQECRDRSRMPSSA
eukprot:TRINITY_DN527_c0_g1_i12.p1 TRINITY_DN527_c0_g1~~TRINITY_DN527_c0_g1_i12.p1  ORF type:complete len:187 (-),score=27.66 TRINITY_DN527_c0_g1_i12:23-583(-)